MGMKTILLTITIFLMFLLPVYGAVNVEEVQLTPSTPKTGDDLTCSFNVTATDNESLETVNITWINGSTIHTGPQNVAYQNNTLESKEFDSSNTKKDETWKCEIYAEGDLSNTSTKTDNVQIMNTAPSVSVSNKEVEIGDSLSFNVGANDPDVDDGADSLAYGLSNAPSGMSINNKGKITWTPQENQSGDHNNINVTVEDENVATDSDTFNVQVIQMKLAVNDLDASCSPSCDENLDEEKGGSIEEVVPGAEMDIEITLENLWDDDVDDHDIEDIEIIGTLENMGDEDEQEEKATKSRIRPEDDADFTLSYEIPEETDEGGYYLELEITGEDENGTDYEINLDIDVDVEKEDEKLIFDRASVLPSMVSCSRDIQVRTRVKNTGADDQERAELTIRNDILGINKHEFFDVESGDYDDDDTEYEATYNYNIPETIEPGEYEIELRAYYEDGGKYERKLLPVTVQECQISQPDEQDDDEQDNQQDQQDEQDDDEQDNQQDQQDEQEVEVIEDQQPPTQTPGQQPAQPVTEESESFYDSNLFLGILGAAFVILLAAVVLLAIIAFKK